MFFRCGRKWKCSNCPVVIWESRAVRAAATVSKRSPVAGKLSAGANAGLVGDRAMNPPHTPQRWEKYMLTFCSASRTYRTADGRQLADECQPSRKGRESSARIQAGLFAQRPAALQRALDERDFKAGPVWPAEAGDAAASSAGSVHPPPSGET